MKNPLQRIFGRLTSVVLIAAFFWGMLPVLPTAAANTSQVERLNVMLVIDGSTSLQNVTDRGGLRYDAIDLFLALLTNSGNNVGALVFYDGVLMHSPIAPIDGKSAKLELSKKIRDAGTDLYTNIGGALLDGVEEAVRAHESNGLKSVVLLFSDGWTQVSGGNDALQESLAQKEQAMNMANQSGIPVHTICLCATADAKPDELREIADRTGGTCEEVKRAEDLTGAFENFYSLIFPDSSSEMTQTTFPASGELSLDIPIPGYGAEEVNIILNATGLKGRSIISPDKPLTQNEIDEYTMSGGFYDVIKLVQPQRGYWTVKLQGDPGKDVTVNVVYNIDSTVKLSTADGGDTYAAGSSIRLQAHLLQQGAVITDKTVTEEYTATLTLTNQTTGQPQQVEMTVENDGSFSYTHQDSGYNSWTASVCFTYKNSNVVLDSNTLQFRFENTPPEASAQNVTLSAIITPFGGKEVSLDLNSYFTDAQDSDLIITIDSTDLDKSLLNLTDGKLIVNTGESGNGNIQILATDSQGASAAIVVEVSVSDLTLLFILIPAILILVVLLILIIWLYKRGDHVWSGSIVITSGSRTYKYGDIRRKKKFSEMGVIGAPVDGSLVAIENGRLELRTTRPVYYGTQPAPSTKWILRNGSTNHIYVDKEHTKGISIQLVPSRR